MALPQVDQPQAPDTVEKLLWVYKVSGKKPTAKKRVPREITEKIRRSWRREVELDPQLCPEEIMSREVALG